MVVLIVDDDDVSRLVAEHILRGGGHDVVAAETAEAALEWLSCDETRVDLVVCDYHMPGASGLDLLERLGDHDAAPNRPPFILLTGIGERDELNDARTAQVSGYLTKPVRSGELLEMVAALAS